jgi:hypothetical protein
LVPGDLAAIWLTLKMVDLMQQGSSRGCTDIKF